MYAYSSIAIMIWLLRQTGLLRDFNLVVTTSRGNEEDLCSEIWYLLREIGDAMVQVEKTGVSGLIVAKTALNPVQVIEKLRDILEKRPGEFRHTLRVTPIQRVVRTELGEIERVATKLASEIEEDETFRVTVEKRFTELSSKEIVEAAAANVERKVDLENPSKIILVEVVGRLTGLSILEPRDVMSVMKERVDHR
ncbi:MAG: THUMP domain-containing protein [Candidatus Bathyarchaeota archaeon]|nr:MAG: THUMP domain-containing protein [Candidatus Bathyarchaeota archaeon]